MTTLLVRALRLRCPRCGVGKLFLGWFAMNEDCPGCGLRYTRGPGYFLGSIYVNYGLTAAVITAAYLGLFLGAGVSPDRLVWWLAGFSVVFPLWFFRYARSIWLAFDVYFDPPKGL